MLARVRQAVVAEFPAPVWVRGEVTGIRRTSGGAVFFRLADPERPGASLDVAARGRVMAEIDRALASSGLGSIRDGIEVRVEGTVDLAPTQSRLRLSLLAVDPTFTAGKLALDRADILRRMTADGTIGRNGELPIPLVPLRVGLVTSRGSAAHADFLHQLAESGYRFALRTAHTAVQGEEAPDRIARAIGRVGDEPVDMIALIRGGGSKLDLAVFDTEVVARAVAKAPVPVITGIGHEIDHTIADQAAAVAEKTPTAAGQWLVGRVRAFAGRLDMARHVIRREAEGALARHRAKLASTASTIAGGAGVLARQRDRLDHLGADLATAARRSLTSQGDRVEALAEWFGAIGLERTLSRGFAVVTTEDGSMVIRSVSQVSPGARLLVRLADGTVTVTAEES